MDGLLGLPVGMEKRLDVIGSEYGDGEWVWHAPRVERFLALGEGGRHQRFIDRQWWHVDGLKFTRQQTAALALDPLFSKVNGLSKSQLQTAVGYLLLLLFFFVFFFLFKAPERYSKWWCVSNRGFCSSPMLAAPCPPSPFIYCTYLAEHSTN